MQGARARLRPRSPARQVEDGCGVDDEPGHQVPQIGLDGDLARLLRVLREREAVHEAAARLPDGDLAPVVLAEVAVGREHAPADGGSIVTACSVSALAL